MFKKIAIVVLVLIVAVLAYAATRPDTLHVQRSASVKAPPEKIFPLISDFHHWTLLVALAKARPRDEEGLQGRGAGKGAVYEWEGNSEVGQGRMEITDTSDPSRITIKLDFIEPLKATMSPSSLWYRRRRHQRHLVDGRTEPFIGKLIGVFVNMDTMIGRDFEAGLANLKAIAEK